MAYNIQPLISSNDMTVFYGSTRNKRSNKSRYKTHVSTNTFVLEQCVLVLLTYPVQVKGHCLYHNTLKTSTMAMNHSS